MLTCKAESEVVIVDLNTMCIPRFFVVVVYSHTLITANYLLPLDLLLVYYA